MTREMKGVLFVSYSLSALYGAIFVIYGAYLTWHKELFVFVVLNAALFLCSFAVARGQEWARRLFIILNTLVGLDSLILFMQSRSLDFLIYALTSILAILYLMEIKTKLLFQSGLKVARKSILIIDDDEMLLKTIKGILLPSGYSVLSANTGEKGLQVARLQKPDLIILDVILPGIKGREVCMTLKEDEQTKNIPVIFLTSKNSPDDVYAEIAAGGAAHLTKPMHSKILMAEIKKVLK